MKKFFSWTLLFIVALKIGGFIVILSVEKEMARKQMKQKIAESIDINTLTCIVGTPENLQKIEWEEDEKEFWFENELYDIVKTQTRGRLTYYYCLSDAKEKEVIAKIKQFSSNLQSQNPISSSTKQVLTLIFQPIIFNLLYSPSFKTVSYSLSTKFKSITTFYQFLHIAKLLEPPQF
ncbi:hypothetical protein GCM10011514_14010 [Emticicia aquatilis]|uniref:Uncharacterized protein n=1 Tax=Emticicia aquatilis TaxID=1537369 RepID=A0A916YN45_9BACT|nr:hypothetical protein [Emticicia aquatilis]GGD50958.1 hypothetical protein GCM10011514_14010 [Emticicia aquatilis]